MSTHNDSIAAQWLRPIANIRERMAHLPANTMHQVEAIDGDLDQLEATITGTTEHIIMANSMLGILIEDFRQIEFREILRRMKTIQQGLQSLVDKSGGDEYLDKKCFELPPMYFFDPEDPEARIKVIERSPGRWGFLHMQTLHQWGSYPDEYAAIAVASMNFQEVKS